MATDSKNKILGLGVVPNKNIKLQAPPQPLGKVLTEQELAAEQANEQKPTGLRGELADAVANSKNVLGQQVASGVTNTGTAEPQKEISVNTPQDTYGYQMLLDAFNDNEKRIADEEERMKRNKLMTTIGDGLSAFHEAYSHARKQKPLTSGSLTGKWRERMDRLQAERNANHLALINAQMNIKNARDLEKYRNDSMKIRQQQQDRLEAQSNLALRKQDWLEKYQQGRLDLEHERNEIDRQYKAGMITKMERDAASRELTAQAAWLRAQKYNTGGSGGGGGGGNVKPKDDPNYEQQVTTDPVTGTKTTRYVRVDQTPTKPAGNNKGGNNTPPSRSKGKKKSKDTSNTPPSRRPK